jgi:hypothetical protein
MFDSIVYGLTVGFVVSFVIAVIFRLLRGATHKLCPACHGNIPIDARKCYHCGEAIEIAVSESAEISDAGGDTANSSRTFWIVVGAVIVFFVFIAILANFLLP